MESSNHEKERRLSDSTEQIVDFTIRILQSKFVLDEKERRRRLSEY